MSPHMVAIMEWISELIGGHSTAHAIFLLGIVASCGLALGSLKIRGVGLGIGGVLFSGLLAGHLGLRIDPRTLEFAREFGLILFVYTIGMQVGPGFIASLRNQGLPLNLLAAAIVMTGAVVTIVINKIAAVPIAAAVGLFSGATTNTPSLGAAQEAIKGLPGVTADLISAPAVACAVAYPFGLLGIILAMLVLRGMFKVDVKKEADALEGASKSPQLSTINLVVQNENLEGLRIDQIPGISAMGVVISRFQHGKSIEVAKPESVLHKNDILLAVGSPAALEQLRVVVGAATSTDLRDLQSPLITRRIVVTKKAVLGKAIGELDLARSYNVNITRITRAEVELSARSDMRLQFGDMLVVVGEQDAIERAAAAFGNSVKQLNHTEIIPIFIGISLGVFFGTLPVALPWLPAPVKLGLAGGPLLTAIVLSRIGRIGPLLWHMPINANFALREIGLILFLACVGLASGERFFETLIHGNGLAWIGYGALITMLPLLVCGTLGRLYFRLNFPQLCGLLAGSMTSPALSFANTVAKSDAPSVAFATVYPLTMLLRVLVAQILVLTLS